MRAAIVLFIFSTAMADGFVRVDRKDWVADWDTWVMRSTVTATGKILRFLSPGPRARREILLRTDFEAQLAGGSRKVGGLQHGATRIADVLAAGPMKLLPLQVGEISVDEGRVRGVEVAGDSVLAFWTLPKEGKSTLYLQGRKTGRVTVRLSLGNGTTQQFFVDVP
jgi:hypothetical protein